MITRTMTTFKCVILVLKPDETIDHASVKCPKKEFTKSNGENYLKKAAESLGCTFVKLVSAEEETERYGMSEATFMTYAKKLEKKN